MKNIFLLSTDKKTNLVRIWNNVEKTSFTLKVNAEVNDSFKEFVSIYITNDEPIKINEPYLGKDSNTYYLCEGGVNFNGKEIVLTNDKDLIEDGVQAVDNLFLSFYAENQPDYVEVVYEPKNFFDVSQGWEYSLIFPQKDKQTAEEETLQKIKSVLPNESQAIRLIEQYGEWIREIAQKE